jgi:hypothetical protein
LQRRIASETFLPGASPDEEAQWIAEVQWIAWSEAIDDAEWAGYELGFLAAG